MRVFVILFIIAGVMLVYQFPSYDSNNPEYFKFFILNQDVEMSWRNYLWHLGNNIRQVGFFYIIFHLISLRYKPYAWLFLAMQIFLFVEFILLYNASSLFMVLGYKIGLSHFFIIFNALILAKVRWEQSK